MFTIFLLYTIVMLSMFLEQRQAGEEDHDEDFLCRFRGQFGEFNLRWSR